jgi:hypothetical protein
MIIQCAWQDFFGQEWDFRPSAAEGEAVEVREKDAVHEEGVGLGVYCSKKIR